MRRRRHHRRGVGRQAPCVASNGLDLGRLFERMPENAPPKLMFRNISPIRENAERILQLLESERTTAGPEPRRDPAL